MTIRDLADPKITRNQNVRLSNDVLEKIQAQVGDRIYIVYDEDLKEVIILNQFDYVERKRK